MLQHISKLTGLCGLLLALSVAAQSAPDTTISAALSNLSARAGSVFAGEVLDVRHNGGIVEIDFRIDQSFKGQPAGAITLREWAGLWAAGQRRYWIGERAVVFLNSPGKSGLSSSVDGMEGILPLAPDTTTVDVRRIRARVQREAGAPMVDAPEQIPISQVASTIHGAPIEVLPTIPVHGSPVRITDAPAPGGPGQPTKGTNLQRYLDASQ